MMNSEHRALNAEGRTPNARHRTSNGRGWRFSLRELGRETLADIRQNRLRSFLTMMGIAWGVASLIILVAMGEGMNKGMREKNELLGKNIIITWGGTTSIPGPGIRPGKRIYLTYEDYELLKREAYWVGAVSPELMRGDLTSATPINRGNFDVSGILPSFQEMRSLRVESGRPLREQDAENAARVCLIGWEVNKQLFNARARPGDAMTIGGLKFEIVGILPLKDQNSNYSGPDNSKIFIPYPAMRRDFPFPHSPMGDREVDDIIAQPVRVDKSDAAEVQMRQVLGRKHLFDPLDEDALPIWNTATEAKMMAQLFGSMKLFLGFVAVVTLLLGGIGVMNIMLVSVRSRIREIGLRKALGATRGNILTMFFTEALLISLGSGLAGYLGAQALCAGINLLPLPDFFAGMIVTRWVGAASFGFLLFVALAAAFYPSYTAAYLDPVEALRFEE